MAAVSDLHIDVIHRHPDWTRALPDAADLGRAAATAAFAAARGRSEGRGPAEAALVLADDAFIRTLNRDYRDRDRATNVLSFASLDEPTPAAPGAPALLGDVIVALETTQGEAEAAGNPLAAHFTHLVVHGMLHLLGFDHETETEAAAMEDLETRVLASLGVADPYADSAAAEQAERP